jgi:protein O-mannosyl-transferase
LYIASLGLFVPAAAVTAGFVRKQSLAGRRVALAGVMLLLGLFGSLSWRRSAMFRDSVTLYTHAVARAPGSIAAHYLLGVALAVHPERASDAVTAFAAALRLNPEAAAVHEKLGTVLLRMPGRTRDGIEHLETALRLNPGSCTTRFALAEGWFDEGLRRSSSAADTGEALVAYEHAIRLRPDFVEAHFNLGNILLRTEGRRADAITHFEIAVKLSPNFAEAHTNLGAALVTEPGRLADAIAHFEAALRANPDYAPARNNLARARQLQE